MAHLEEYDWWLINELSFKIHTSKDIRDMRNTVLDWLKKVIDYDMASFFLVEEDRGNLQPSDPVFVNFDSRSSTIYKNVGEEIDFNEWLFYNRKPPAYRETDLISEEAYRSSKIYQKFYKPCNIAYAARMFLIYDGSLTGLITLYRKHPKDNFSERDLYILDMLQDHISYKLLTDRIGQDPITGRNEKYEKIALEYNLTPKETMVFTLTLLGLDNVAISDKLCISPNTLKKHYSSIYDKLNITSKMQLLQMVNKIEEMP